MTRPEGDIVAVLDTTRIPVADLYRNHILLQGIQKTEDQIQSDVDSSYRSFQQAFLDEIEDVTRKEPVLITGQDAVDNAQRKGLAMENNPLTVLGQSFYRNILTRTGELWTAYNIYVSRLYVPSVSEKPVGYIPQVNQPPVDRQTREIADSLKQAGKGAILLADDNSSLNANTFVSTAKRFQQNGIETEAYIAGFYAGPEYDEHGDRTKINGIPMYAVRSRFSTPEDMAKAKRGEIPTPASIETIDMLYLPNSGVALSEGFPEASDKIVQVRNYLQDSFSLIKEGHNLNAENVKHDIERFGIEVGNAENLLNYLVSNKDIEQIGISQLVDLLGKPEGEKSILHIPNFHIRKPDSRRIPHIWPGEKEKQSFWNHMNETTWKIFSSRMQEVTINLLSELERASGYEIPSSLFPFLSLPDVTNRFPNGVPLRAIDAIRLLRRDLHKEMYRLTL